MPEPQQVGRVTREIPTLLRIIWQSITKNPPSYGSLLGKIIKQQVDTTPKTIIHNPFRVLGVYANSPRRDIISNKGKASAFLRTNRLVEFPLDLKGILPPLSRTLDLMNEAEAHLAIAKEQIKYAQFWFLQKMSPLDDIAFNRLLAGNMAEAIEIWSKQDSLSSLQNKLVCYLIEGKHRAAVLTAEKLYEKFGDVYINKIDANCTLKMTGTELMHQFLESLGDEIGYQIIIGYITGGEAKAFIRSKAVGPLINKISSEVDKAKKVDHNDSGARIEAADKLVERTKEAFEQLKMILSVTDPQYQMIADKLGLEILQCGIDYFNNSNDNNAARIAMGWQKYAQSIVVGTIAKQRCDENVRILQKIIDELPPSEVIAEDKAIKAELSKYVRLPDKISYAIILLNNTKPHLQSIKKKLGATNKYYLKMSTQIVGNALHNVIEEVNKAQEPLNKLSELLSDMDPYLRRSFLSDSGLDFDTIRNELKSTLKEAWRATQLMDGFDLESGFKTRYNQNRTTLRSLCSQMGVSTYGSSSSTSSQPASRSTTSYSGSSSSRSASAYSGSSSSSGNGGCVLGVIVLLIVGLIAFFNMRGSSTSSSSAQRSDYANVEESADSMAYEEDDIVLAKDNSDEEEYVAEADNSYNEVHHSTGDRPYQTYYGRGEYDKRTDNSLTIMNEYDRDAVVFLETTSGRKTRHVYINASNSFTMSNIPAGRYVVKIMQGTSWNPDKDNGPNAPKGGFMQDLSMSESGTSDIFEFPPVSSGQYGSYEITLYKVQNGNLSTYNIDNEAMFN